MAPPGPGAKCRRNWATAALDAFRGLGYQGACETILQHEGALMAIDPSGGHPAMDYAEHTRTYSGFLRATVTMIALVVVILLFLLSLVP
jgi:type IV secretory pathway TrbL component